jgi:hypothetical protein
VDVDEDEEEEEWHLDVEEEDIQDATNINMDEIDDMRRNSTRVANVCSFYQSGNEALMCVIY